MKKTTAICWCVCLLALVIYGPVALAQNQVLAVPGTILGHKAATDRIYIGSPSICILLNGDYVASNDFFGPGPDTRRNGKSVTRVYRSVNAGISWTVLTDIVGQFMSNLFVYRNSLYIIGLSGGSGNIIIRKSDDNGLTWTEPTDNEHGLLRTGRFHTAPTPVVEHNGRLWRAMEDMDGDIHTWPKEFRAFMMSVPINTDLLKATNWTWTNSLPYNSSYLNGYFYGWLEGNAVVTPDGNMIDLLRVHTFDKLRERAAIVTISADGKKAAFDADKGFINFPGGGKKFTVKYDQLSGKYWTLSNYVPEQYQGIKSLDQVRNTLALCSSKNLLDWKVDAVLLAYPDMEKHGFQYLDWAFDGNDIVAVSRTAYDDGLGGANSHHNSNFLTFHRFKNFRSMY